MTPYKLLTYDAGRGPCAGVLVNSRLHDANVLLRRDDLRSIDSLLADWSALELLLADAIRTAPASELAVDEVRVLAPLLHPGTVFCAGANYQDHVDRMGEKQGVPSGPSPRALGLSPFHFIKAARCVVGPHAEIPHISANLDYEGELAAIIGRAARNISVADALDYVAGYTVANDLSARDRLIRDALPPGAPFRFDWTAHKNFDSSCPIGPYIVPATFIADPQALTIKTWVNGDIRQDSTTSKMIYPLAELIAHLSTTMTLHPGDIVLTGTPAGVAAESGNFLKPGDEIRIEIENVGTLINKIGASAV